MEPQAAGPVPLTKRLTPSDWFALDVVLAVFLTASSILSLVLSHDKHPSGRPVVDALRVLLVLAGCLSLPARRRYPVFVLAVTVFADTVLIALGTSGPAHVAAGFAMYTVAVSSDRRLPWRLVAAVVVPVVAASLVHTAGRNVQGVVFAPAVLLVGWLAGENARARRAYTAELTARVVERERERARREAADERARIARELHDVVAHTMSVVAVRSGVARAVLSARPEEAGEALGIIETVSKRGLAELRRIVGVLRRSEEPDPDLEVELAPSPGLHDLPGLVDDLRLAGVRVELVTEGEPRPLPPGEDLSAFRIAQEALTNVVRHTVHATAVLTVHYGDRCVEIACVDDGGTTYSSPTTDNGTGHGHGIVGMRERAALYGGELEAGPHGHGFRVHARLPVVEETM